MGLMFTVTPVHGPNVQGESMIAFISTKRRYHDIKNLRQT
jgi:hypothetical protein